MKVFIFFGMGVLVGVVVCVLYLINRCGYIVEEERYEAKKNKENFLLLDMMARIENGEEKWDCNKAELKLQKVAVYGKGIVGNHLIRILQAEQIAVECVIDKGSAGANSSIPVVDGSARFTNVDTVIVTPFMEYQEIYEQVRRNNPDINIVDVRDLF